MTSSHSVNYNEQNVFFFDFVQYNPQNYYLCTSLQMQRSKIMELIARPHYYSKVEKLLGKGILIVLTGQRCVGKSYQEPRSEIPESYR